MFLKLFYLITVLMLYDTLFARQTGDEQFVIDTFEMTQEGTLPTGWYTRNASFELVNGPEWEKESYFYTVRKEGDNKFLRFEGVTAKHINFPLANKKNVDIYKTPYLSWKWRIHDLPEGANEDDNDLNDTAASIYVVFDMGKVLFKKVPKSIRYTWSSTLPAGTELSKFYGNQKIVVMGSGEPEDNDWMHFQRNIIEDYRRLFGDAPPSTPLAILLLSDGDSTNDFVKADYDDIMLKMMAEN